MLFRIWLYPHVGGRGVYVLTPCRMDDLACGALLALVLGGGVDVRRLLPYTRPLLFGCALGLFVIALWRGHLDAHDPIVQLIGYPLSAWASVSRPDGSVRVRVRAMTTSMSRSQ